MRILVTGSRTYTDQDMVNGVLAAVCARVPQDEDITIIDGKAKGADKWASMFGSSAAGIYHERYAADWDTYGNGAGPIRNKQMLESGADIVIAFKQDFDWSYSHGGTENCVQQARAAGVPCIVVCEAP